MSYKIKEFISFLVTVLPRVKYTGDLEKNVTKLAPIEKTEEDTLSWIKSVNKYESIKSHISSVKGVVIVDNDTQEAADFDNAIVCDNPKFCFALLSAEFFNHYKKEPGIGKGNCIDNSVDIGNNVHIGNNCTIGKNVSIGDNTIIYNNVVVADNVKIGSGCLIKSNAVIGEEGFSVIGDGEHVIRVSHNGSVVIGNNVEIGCFSSIDRGTIDDTVIGDETMISDRVIVAHNSKIGKRVIITGGAVICGSVNIGDDVYVGPHATILNKLDVGRNSVITIGAVLMKNAEEDTLYMGNPARAIRKVSLEDRGV